MRQHQPLPRVAIPVACVALAVLAGCVTTDTNPPPTKAAITAGPVNPAPATAPAGAAATPEALRQAERLRNTQHFEEARKAYEAWLAAHPKDPEPLFDLGYTLYLEACAEGRTRHANGLRLQARDLIREARQLGSKWANIIVYDGAIGPDGADTRRYEGNPEAERLTREGERLYSQGRYNEALQSYQAALAADPRAYGAALFSGDCYFAQKDFGRANEWFSKAVGINPDREVAYRYWADSLLHQGRVREARENYINAVIAEPYSALARKGLQNFADARGITLHHPPIKHWEARAEWDGKKATIYLHPDHIEPLAIAYAGAQALWLDKERAKFFPADAPVRHSLPEELHGLRATVLIARELAEKEPTVVAPWKETIDTLDQLDMQGLLEAYVLLDSVDEGIAQDYAGYRLQHREALVTYVRKVWLEEK